MSAWALHSEILNNMSIVVNGLKEEQGPVVQSIVSLKGNATLKGFVLKNKELYKR